MRMKSLFIAALATMALASCNNEEARKTPTGARKNQFRSSSSGSDRHLRRGDSAR